MTVISRPGWAWRRGAGTAAALASALALTAFIVFLVQRQAGGGVAACVAATAMTLPVAFARRGALASAAGPPGGAPRAEWSLLRPPRPLRRRPACRVLRRVRRRPRLRRPAAHADPGLRAGRRRHPVRGRPAAGPRCDPADGRGQRRVLRGRSPGPPPVRDGGAAAPQHRAVAGAAGADGPARGGGG